VEPVLIALVKQAPWAVALLLMVYMGLRYNTSRDKAFTEALHYTTDATTKSLDKNSEVLTEVRDEMRAKNGKSRRS